MEDVPRVRDAATALADELTVCICTRNRPKALERALGSVAEYAAGAPVVISDDGDLSETRPTVARFNGCAWQDGPRRGLGANRNAAVSAAKSPWILFLDDDARIGEGFLAAMANQIEENGIDSESKIILTGAELKNGKRVIPHDVDFLGFQKRAYGSGDALHTVVINAALWPRSLFDHACFDEKLQYGSDEVDLSYAALAAGYRIEPCLEAVNYHDPDSRGRESYADSAQVSRLRATTKRYWRLQRRWGRGLAFVLLAPLHLVFSMVTREGFRGLVGSAAILRRWLFA